MNKRLIIILIMVLLLVGCNKKKKINTLIKSNDSTDIIKGFYLIGESNDTAFVPDIFTNVYDPRISHFYKFYGISVYQSKMNAIKKISQIAPPRNITRDPDSLIIKFYLKWAIQNGYVFDKSIISNYTFNDTIMTSSGTTSMYKDSIKIEYVDSAFVTKEDDKQENPDLKQ